MRKATIAVYIEQRERGAWCIVRHVYIPGGETISLEVLRDFGSDYAAAVSWYDDFYG